MIYNFSLKWFLFYWTRSILIYDLIDLFLIITWTLLEFLITIGWTLIAWTTLMLFLLDFIFIAIKPSTLDCIDWLDLKPQTPSNRKKPDLFSCWPRHDLVVIWVAKNDPQTLENKASFALFWLEFVIEDPQMIGKISRTTRVILLLSCSFD